MVTQLMWILLKEKINKWPQKPLLLQVISRCAALLVAVLNTRSNIYSMVLSNQAFERAPYIML